MEPEAHGYISSAKECYNIQGNFTGTVCNATWDTITCWSPTPSGVVAKQLCPVVFGALSGKYVYKKCETDGTWARPEFWKGFGYSDYSECVDHISMIADVFETGEDSLNAGSAGITKNVTSVNYVTSLSLLAVSLASLVISMACFHLPIARTMSNATKYRIICHLFSACILETFINLVHASVLVLDVYTNITGFPNNSTAVEKVLIAFSEYGYSVVCIWVFIGSHYIQMRTQSGHLCMSGYLIYCFIGWGIPVLPTVIWTLTSFLSHNTTYWIGYKSQPIVWILYIPRILMLCSAIGCIIVGARNLHQKANNVHRNNWFRHICLELLVYSTYVSYICIRQLINIANNYFNSDQDNGNPLGLVCAVFDSAIGVFITILFWTLDAGIRNFLKKKLGRVSREGVRTCTEQV